MDGCVMDGCAMDPMVCDGCVTGADRTVVVTPVIDVIDKETFQYHGNPNTPMKGVCRIIVPIRADSGRFSRGRLTSTGVW